MHRDSLRNEILDQAVQLTSVRGLHGLTIGKLAAAVRMSKGGICAHFPSKAQLQLAVVERASETFAQAAIQPALARPAGLLRLQALGECWFAYLKGQVFRGGCFFSNALYELDDLTSGPLLEAVRAAYRRYLAYLEGQAAIAVEQGEFWPGVDPAHFAQQFHAFQLSALTHRSLGQVDLGLEFARRGTDELLAQARLRKSEVVGYGRGGGIEK